MREEGDVIVPDVEPEAFKLMLRFIYTDQIELNGTYVMHVLHAAKKYQLPSLVQLCIDYLDKELDATTACSILGHSLFFNEGALAQRCVERIQEKTEEALSSADFMKASKETLSAILDSDKLAMEELKLFDRCCEWARNKADSPESIREALGACHFKIPFPTMPIKEFTDAVCSTGILTSEEQLRILKYMASPSDNSKPRDFNCAKRKGCTLIAPGDYVAVIRGDRYSSDNGVVYAIGTKDQLLVKTTAETYASVWVFNRTFDILLDNLKKLKL